MFLIAKKSSSFSLHLFFQPPTEKLHQIIARTALFVSKHGGQSEIVLRVKQGDNPTFGFLMPDHHLHAYFRFLVDNQELLQSKDKGKPEIEGKISNTEHGAGVGALSLLGSLYGTGEDEDGAAEKASASKENLSGETVDVSATVPLVSDKIRSPVHTADKDEVLSKPSLLSKEKVAVLRRNSFTSVIKAGSSVGMRKGDISGSFSAAPEKSRASSLPLIPRTDHLLLEPPSDLKRLVDKIVEFILKNGKQFEAVLLEQDREHGRFPFLMPSNLYHPYYLKVLQKAQESKSSAKSLLDEKDVSDKTVSVSKKSDSLSFDSAGCDVAYDSDRKEKFKMVIGKSKKDGPDPPCKDTQQRFGVSVDAAQVAAILQAATRGIKNPDLGILNGNNNFTGVDGGQPTSLGSRHSSRPENLSSPGVKANEKVAAVETANEAGPSEAHLTREQKLKAERLKRAKMFMATLKHGDAPSTTEPSRGLLAEPLEPGASGLGVKVNITAKEREGSSAPLDIDSSDKTGKPGKNHFDDEYHERKLRRKYRSRSGRHDEDEAEEDDNDDDGGGDKSVHKHTRKKPLRSSVEDDKGGQREDETRRKKHHSYHSSPDDDNDEERDHIYSKKKHREHRSSHEDDNEEETDEERDHKYSRKKHRLRHSYDDDDEERENEHERDPTYSRKKHRSHRSSNDDGQEDEDGMDYRYSRNKRSSREDDEQEEGRHHRRSRKKHRSHRSSHHSRDRHKHRKYHSSSKDRESRHRHKYDSSGEERSHRDRADTDRKQSHAGKDDLEEGEISPKISDQSRGYVGNSASREASVDISISNQEERAPSQPSDTSGVPNDLRAKIRAMLMSTM